MNEPPYGLSERLDDEKERQFNKQEQIPTNITTYENSASVAYIESVQRHHGEPRTQADHKHQETLREAHVKQWGDRGNGRERIEPDPSLL